MNSGRGLPPAAVRRRASVFSWLGLPPVEWSLLLLGLCIYTFVIVTYYLPIAQVGIAIAIAGLILQRSKLRVPLPVWLCAAFVLWAYIASYASPHPDIALDSVVEFLKLLVGMLVTTNALRKEGQLRFYLLFFLGCFMLFPVRGTLLGGDEIAGRVVWNFIYTNSNELATLSVLVLGIALGFLFSTPSRMVRLGAGLSVILLLVVILLTQSRGAFIGLVAGMGPALLWSGLKRPGRLILSAGALALVMSLTVPAAVWERLSGIGMLTSTSTIALADPEGSAAERFEILKVGWQIFIDRPVFGVGLGAYKIENAAYSPVIGRMDAHNAYLTLAAETGLPGLLLWCAMVLSVLRYAYRSRRLAASGELSIQQAWMERAFWAFLVSNIFGGFTNQSVPYLVLAVLWCSATLLAPASQLPAATPRPAKRIIAPGG